MVTTQRQPKQLGHDPRAARSDGGTRSNQNAFNGQVVGDTVVIGNIWFINYRQIVIPVLS